jgi:hypothetical protein
MKLQLSCFHAVWVLILYLVIFIAKLKLLQKPVFQQHRGRHLDGVFTHLFSQGLKLIWVKTAWLYLYRFKSYDRLKSTVNLLLHPPVYEFPLKNPVYFRPKTRGLKLNLMIHSRYGYQSTQLDKMNKWYHYSKALSSTIWTLEGVILVFC